MVGCGIFGCIPWGGIARSSGSPIFHFVEYTFTFPLILDEGFSFHTSSPTFVVICILHVDHSDWPEMETQNGFDFHSLMGEDIEHFLKYLLVF